MKVLGIVGHEAAKFTPETERVARATIREAIRSYAPEAVCSGECPLGGVDHWAREESVDEGVPFIPYAPTVNRWDGEVGFPKGIGFKQRNLQIAAACLVVNVVVRDLPASYKGRRFPGCYHCHTRVPLHTKSGGCWTAWKAKRREWRIIGPEGVLVLPA